MLTLLLPFSHYHHTITPFLTLCSLLSTLDYCLIPRFSAMTHTRYPFLPCSMPTTSVMHTYNPLHTHYLLTTYSLHTHYLLTTYPLPTHYPLTTYSLPTHYLLFIYSLSTHYLLTTYSLPTHYLLTTYSLQTH